MRIQTDAETLKKTRQSMQMSLLSTILCPGWMAGMDTVQDCMKDEDIRPFLGHALLHEIMPNLGLTREDLDPMAMQVCGEMEHSPVRQPLTLLMNGAVEHWRSSALPILRAYEEREDALPPCLTLGLSCLIMLFAGVRQQEDGRYACIRNEENCYLSEDADILSAFAPLSCDMPPEMLSYAALSDRMIWHEDLREIPGLEALVSDQLRDLQLIGLRASLQKAWKNEEE